MSDASSGTPRLSVVLVAAGGAPLTARTCSHLQQQTIRSSIELIVVARDEEDVAALPLRDAGFAAVRIVPVGEITRRGAAAAAGVRVATAPIIALIEDHSYPEASWAESLLEAHEGDWAGVGPVVRNANPGSALSWVTFVITYGSFSGEQPAGARDIIPWHNSAYKREHLDARGSRLDDLLEWEGRLQEEIVREGHSLTVTTGAVTSHVNVSRAGSVIRLLMCHSQLLGSARAAREHWRPMRRLLYAVVFPIYPFFQARTLLAMLKRQPLTPVMRLRVFLLLVPALAAMAVGEARGVLFGDGDAIPRIEDFELHRVAHVTRSERGAMLTAPPSA